MGVTVRGKIRLLMLVLGLCCFVTTLSLKTFTSNKHILLHEAGELQNNLIKKEKTATSFFTDPNKIEVLKKLVDDDSLAIEFINLYRPQGINIFIYKNNMLEFWSTQAVLPPNILKLKEGVSFNKLPNGYYETIKKTVGNYKFVFLITVKSQYKIENQYLKNEIIPELFPNKTLDIAGFSDKETTEIFSAEKDYLFTVKLSSGYNHNIYTTLQAWLWILGLLSICLFVNSCCLWLAKRDKLVLSTLIITIFFLTLRLTDLHFFWLNHQFNSEIFNPVIYAESDLLPSLGDLLNNTLAVTWILTFIYVHRKKYRWPQFIANNKPVVYLLAMVFLSIIWWLGILTEDIFFGLIYNSKIEFNINNIVNLSYISWICILILCLFWLNIYMLIHVFVEWCNKLGMKSLEKWVVFFLLLIAYTIYKLYTDYTVFYLIYGIFIAATAHYYTHRNKKYIVSIFTLIYLCLALLTAIKYLKFTDIKERSSRAALAEKLLYEEDPKLISSLEEIEKNLATDTIITNYFKQPLLTQTYSFHNYIIKNYLDGYLSKYEFNIYEYNVDNSSLKRDESLPIHKYYDLVKSGAIKTQQSDYFYRVNDTFGFQNYFGIIPIFSGPNFLGSIIIDLKTRAFDYDAYFPDLLINGKIRKDEDLSQYSLAFYKDNQLVSRSGKYVYPVVNNLFKDNIDGVDFYNEKSTHYNHAIYAPSKNRLIVISKEKVPFTERLTTVSFFFLIFIIFGACVNIIVWFAVNISKSKGGIFTINKYLLISEKKILYKTRIQFSIIFSVVATLIIVGWATFFNIKQQYLEQQKQELRDKMRKVQVGYERYVATLDKISISEDSKMEFNQFADVNGALLNLYDKDGNLILSSIPKLFDYGIIAPRMGAIAYINLSRLKKSEFLNSSENIASFKYAAIYAPIRNAMNQTIGYLGFPYYSTDTDYKAKIAQFINTLINIYALVFVLIGVLAVFLANQITSPLTFIQENIKEIKLGQKNQPIVWHRQDEIGSLIREYNKMIAELEISANKLARSERESAWREMAKQVAHEIKNPLTPLKLGVQLIEKSWRERDPNFESKFEKFNKSFVEQIDSLATIASEFSNFAKMPDTKVEKLELLPIIEQAIAVFSSADNVEINIKNNTSKPLVVMGDKDQLLRTFNNLFKNAIEASEQKAQCIINLFLANDEQNAYIQVQDNGKGIDPKLYHRIFIPNFTTKSSGTGLGLAFVKQAIENTGGKIDFSSVVNKGTKFYLTFPLV